MDLDIQNILMGLITNGLAAFIAQFLHRESQFLIGEVLISKAKSEREALQPILKKAANRLAESIEWQDVPTLEVVCLFLSSPEAETIIRQIYAAQLSLDENRTNWETIQREFQFSFYYHTISYPMYAGLKEDQFAEVSKLLLETLINGCEQALATAIDRGILSAHEAKSSFRHLIILDKLASIEHNVTSLTLQYKSNFKSIIRQRMILDELAALRENVAFLTSRHLPNINSILEFEKKYHQQVGDRHWYIIPPNFDKVRKLPIDDLFVYPKFLIKGEDEKSDEMSMSKFFLHMHRAVLLGQPGGGKSTFTLKLCHDLVTHPEERLIAGRREVTPILVVLRDYGAMKKTDHCSILEYIRIKANADYQVVPPSGAFEYLLLNNRALIIFDGLDELLDTSYRQEITSDVESFCNLYPSVPVLITSRTLGYDQAPLDKERFEIFHLAPFDKGQVQEYIKKWFSVLTDLTPAQQKQKMTAFLEDSQVVLDLCSNPLMLALLCNIYREENYIPKNRPEVYKKCATLLFERWDKSRGIQIRLPFEAHIRPAMMYLANWIYSHEDLRGGVVEKRLIEKTKQYLCQKLYEDPDEAEKAAQEFIDFCRGRAWVFTDIGTTKDGKDLYQFTHQTFLEYFTAAYLCRTHSTPAALIQVLQPKIAGREWDVVAQLAFQIQNEQIEDAGDILLATLVQQANEKENPEGWNLLSFAAQCLKFIVPNPKVTQDIASSCIERSLKWSVEQIENAKVFKNIHTYYKGQRPVELFAYLLEAVPDNRRTIIPALEKLLAEKVENGSDLEAIVSSEIRLYLEKFPDFHFK